MFFPVLRTAASPAFLLLPPSLRRWPSIEFLTWPHRAPGCRVSHLRLCPSVTVAVPTTGPCPLCCSQHNRRDPCTTECELDQVPLLLTTLDFPVYSEWKSEVLTMSSFFFLFFNEEIVLFKHDMRHLTTKLISFQQVPSNVFCVQRE